MLSLIIFLLMISALISFHELGHFLMAKAFNVYVREFSIGFGPALFKKQGKETLFAIRAIPLGGYNAMVESEDDELSQQIPLERTLYGIDPLKRIVILLAGPIFNIILAIALCIGIYEASPYKVVYPKPIISSVVANTPAEKAGLQANDEIIALLYDDGTLIHPETFYDVTINNALHDGAVTFTVLRNGETFEYTITPAFDENSGSYLFGFMSQEYQYEKMNVWQAAAEGFSYTFEMVGLTLQSLALLVRGSLSPDNLSGTIGMYSVTKEAMSYGVLTTISLAANISVSLGIMNLMPIPTFDGGRILIAIAEKLLGHRLDRKLENGLMLAGLVIMILLFVFTMYLDISKLFR